MMFVVVVVVFCRYIIIKNNIREDDKVFIYLFIHSFIHSFTIIHSFHVYRGVFVCLFQKNQQQHVCVCESFFIFFFLRPI